MIKLKKSEIEKVCNSGVNMIDASKELNVSIQWLKKKAIGYGCWNPLPRYENKIKYPNGNPNSIFSIKDWNNNIKIPVSRRCIVDNIKKYNLLEYECGVCSITTWKGKELSLDLDHINGINDDHRKDNLRYLCPNCHSQTHTFRNKKR
tara:strand:- start:55 stop:498 length:444 start_codon:yes stop_codon:yes gene_type:complete